MSESCDNFKTSEIIFKKENMSEIKNKTIKKSLSQYKSEDKR